MLNVRVSCMFDQEVKVVEFVGDDCDIVYNKRNDPKK
jgi:hypothetical protein